METKEQQLYRINRINRQKLIDELNMKKKNLIVKYKPVKEIDDIPKIQRNYIDYKKNQLFFRNSISTAVKRRTIVECQTPVR
jgi:hypothetical protein